MALMQDYIMSPEEIPFLDDSWPKETVIPLDARDFNQRKHRQLRIAILSNILLFIVCVSLIAKQWLPGFLGDRVITEPYSPANSAVEYEYRAIDGNNTRFLGQPGHDWEQAMHELMTGTLIRVSEDELRLHGSTSIPLKDGGFAAGLGVAHNLHCVGRIKQFIFREVSYSHLGPDDKDFQDLQEHADHCLDFIRQSMMCNVDYSLYTLFWRAGHETHPTHNLPGTLKCVNWEKLHEWMLERSTTVSMLEDPHH
ncbi:hypothetical protein N8I77_005446 [Diaporthe amygdali]|uniref:Tat pathway signal sequence n=1 Tax=Phomopsis amygdali TaxID=1214568 RepID=A0AAD9W5L5_PHOAM|nr:hypothetical protein N8I77_005446 [Diaporthe amygdali]